MECLEIRKIPNFEGYYSLRSDGAVFSDERVIDTARGPMRIKGKQLTSAKYKSKHGTDQDANYKFRMDNKGYSVGLSFLKAITFPEIYNTRVIDLPGEVWVPLFFNEKYSVSNIGRVKRNHQKQTCCGIEWVKSDHLISIFEMGCDGYFFGCRHRHEDKITTLPLGRSVYQSFIRLVGDDEIVCHKDGDKRNNHISNLMMQDKTIFLKDYWSEK